MEICRSGAVRFNVTCLQPRLPPEALLPIGQVAFSLYNPSGRLGFPSFYPDTRYRQLGLPQVCGKDTAGLPLALGINRQRDAWISRVYPFFAGR